MSHTHRYIKFVGTMSKHWTMDVNTNLVVKWKVLLKNMNMKKLEFPCFKNTIWTGSWIFCLKDENCCLLDKNNKSAQCWKICEELSNQ